MSIASINLAYRRRFYIYMMGALEGGHVYRKCADTISTVLVSWAGHFQYDMVYKQHSETVMV